MSWSKSLMGQNGILLVGYNSSTWKITQCSSSAVIGYVLIGLKTLIAFIVCDEM